MHKMMELDLMAARDKWIEEVKVEAKEIRRLTQIMDLLNLAPDRQEEIRFLPRTQGGRDPISERDLRPIAAVTDWRKQRKTWRAFSVASG